MLTRQRINPASLTCNAGTLGEPVRADDQKLTYVYHEFRRDQITGASRTACAPAKPVCATVCCHVSSSPIHIRGASEYFNGIVARGHVRHASNA
jgi:hypothetical protein